MFLSNKWSLSAFLGCLLLLLVTARDERIIISQSEGIITSPSYEECVAVQNKTSLTWEFPVTDNRLYLNIEEISISKCAAVKLYVTDHDKRTAFCKRDKQLYDVYATSVTVEFMTNSDYCKDSFQIRFAYISSDINVSPGKHVAVNQKVTYTAALSRLPKTTISPTCIFYFGDGTQSETWETPKNVLIYSFAFPGSYNYRSVCQVVDVSLTSSGFVKVETNMSHPPLNLWYTKMPFTYQGDVLLRFDHIYSHPIYYYLSVQKSVFATKTTEEFEKARFIERSAVFVLFDLKKIAQKRLGPGLQPFTLSMENNVSCIRLQSEFTLNQPLEEMKVVVAHFVGIHPHPFNINVTFGKGAPADIQITIVERSTSHAVRSLRTVCKKDCKFLQIKATVPKPAVDYMVKATAENIVSSVKAVYGPFAATPYVYDVYVTSEGNLQAGSENIVLIFIRADLGDYTLSILAGEEQQHISVTVRTLTYNHKIDFNFPGNAQKFMSVAAKFKFKTAGFIEVTSVVANIRRTSTFKRSLRVFGDKTCVCTVRIRDGNNLHWTERPLIIGSDVILSSDPISPCKEDIFLRFKWDVFRVESNEQLPLEINQEMFSADNTQPDVIVDPKRLPHGLYMMKLVVTTYDVRTNLALGEAKDFTIFENTKQKVDFVIKGGSVREIGANERTINFETSLPTHKRFYTQWFCARTIEDLPYDADIGKLTRKGSCLGWGNSLYLSSSKNLKLSTANLTKREHYYIRAFSWQNGYEKGFSDQEIVLQPNPAPIITLRCFSNCDHLLFPQLPLILQLDCSDCTSYRWMLRCGESIKTMGMCENNEFCKLDEVLLQSLSPAQSNSLSVRGSNNFGSSIVTLRLFHKPTPKGGKCTVTPPAAIAYSTKFSVVCSGFHDSNNGSLVYKFFLLDNEKQNPLLQHGFDNVLEDVLLSPSSTYQIVFLVKICNMMKSCAVVRVKTYIAPRITQDVFVKSFYLALKSRNLQRMVQAVTSFPDGFVARESMINHAIKDLSIIKLVSVEGVKQTCDVLNHVTANTKLINKESMDTLWSFLSKIQEFLHGHLQHDDITFLVQSCAATASNIIQTRNLNATLREKMSRFAAFGNFIMTSVMPKERPATFSKDGMTASFLRLHKHGEKTSKMPLVTIRNLNAIHTGDVINVEIYQTGILLLLHYSRITFGINEHLVTLLFNLPYFEQVHKYDGSIMNFDTARRRVNDVTSVFITSGLNHPKPVSSKNARKLQSSFVLPPDKITPSIMNLYVFSIHDNVTSQVYAEGSNYVTVTIDPQENLQGALFKIGILNSGLDVEELSFILQNKEDPTFVLRKKFKRKDLLPSTTTYKLTARGNLSSDFNANVKMLEMKIVIYLVNCLYWDDVIADWNDDYCRPISNTTSASMTCECYRFPVITPKRERNRPTKEDLLPTLFATRLVLFPSETIELACIHGMHNPLVVVVILMAAGLCMMLCKWAQRKDKMEEKKNDVIPVTTSSSHDRHRYLVTSYTGLSMSSGSTSRVSMKLIGVNHTSEAFLLQTSQSPVLKRGSVVSFLVATRRRLGDINSVKVWRDDAGSSPGWNVSRIAVKELERNQCWFFICNQRLTTTNEYTIQSSTKDQLLSDRSLFTIKWKNFILDRHLWFSVCGMRPWEQESLSRIQRLALCFLDFFLVMLPASYLHYHSIEGPDERCRDKMGLVIIGVISGALSFPILCLSSALFRIRFKKARKACLEDQKSVSSLDEAPPGDAGHEEPEMRQKSSNELRKDKRLKNKTSLPKSQKNPSKVDEQGLDKGESCELGHKNKMKMKNAVNADVLHVNNDNEVMRSNLEDFSDSKPQVADTVTECEEAMKETIKNLTVHEKFAETKQDPIRRSAQPKGKVNAKWETSSTNDSMMTQAQLKPDSHSFMLDSRKSTPSTAIEFSQVQTAEKLSRWAMKPYLHSDCVKGILRDPSCKTFSISSSRRKGAESSRSSSKSRNSKLRSCKNDSGTGSESFFAPTIQWKKSREEVMRLSLSQSSCNSAKSESIVGENVSFDDFKTLESSKTFRTPPSGRGKESKSNSDNLISKSAIDVTTQGQSPEHFRRRLPMKPSKSCLPKNKRSKHIPREILSKSPAPSLRKKSRDSRSSGSYNTPPSLERVDEVDEDDLDEPPSSKPADGFITAADLDTSPSDIDNFLKQSTVHPIRRKLPMKPGSSRSEFTIKHSTKNSHKANTASNGDTSSDSSDNCLSESHWETINENLKLRPRIRKDIAICYNHAQTFKTTRTRPRDRSSSDKKGSESGLSKSVTFPCFSSEYDSFADNQKSSRHSSSKKHSPASNVASTDDVTCQEQSCAENIKGQRQNKELTQEAVLRHEEKEISIASRTKSPDQISEDLESKVEDNARNLRKLYLLRKLHARKKKFQKKLSPTTSDRDSDEKKSKSGSVLTKQITKKRKCVSEDTYKKLSMSPDEVIEYWLKNTPNYYSLSGYNQTPASSVEVVCSDLSLNSFYTADATETDASSLPTFPSEMKLYPSAGRSIRQQSDHSNTCISNSSKRTHARARSSHSIEEMRKTFSMVDPPSDKEEYTPEPLLCAIWFGLITTSLFCCAVTIMYGMTFELVKSFKWLASVAIGYTETLLILETLFVTLYAVTIVMIYPAFNPRDWIPGQTGQGLPQTHRDPEALKRNTPPRR